MSTPDIFISYARGDADTAKLFAETFRGEGLDVWWDDALQAGEVFDEAIEAALRAAKAVVVLCPRMLSPRAGCAPKPRSPTATRRLSPRS